MPKLVLLWTDVVLLGDVRPAARLRLARGAATAISRATWSKVVRDAPALCAGVVLAAFALVTLVDSVHFRRALPPAPARPRDAPTFYDDADASRCSTRCSIAEVRGRESNYSEPLAYLGFNTEVVERGGKAVRDYPRLLHGGAHLKDPEHRVAAPT